jgi:anhydro-N-acetylmuramic acid kinase
VNPGHRLVAGLMSGTSIDAVDGTIAAFPAQSGERPGLLGFTSRPIPPELRRELNALQSPGPDELARAAIAANALSELYASVVSDLLVQTRLSPSAIAAIGAHGQTVRHRPDLGYTIQLLNPARLAERTAIAVVADLRSADVAAGGQGAPLVPGFHTAVFGQAGVRRAIVNLGGIANVSLIDPSGPATRVHGFDTGPANTLMDLWCERHLGKAFDENGDWAAGGMPIPRLLQSMLSEPFFQKPPPRSTGRDLFNLEWLANHLTIAGCVAADPRDIQASLGELTAASVADACRALRAQEVWLCGGGVRNRWLMSRIAARLAGIPVSDTGELGIDPQAVEALAFAWLANRRLNELPGNLPDVTGAAGPRLLGAIWPAGSDRK